MIVKVFVTGLVVFMAKAGLAANPTIEVLPRVELKDSASILLGDIATFRGVEKSRATEFKSINLGNAPRLGEKRVFTSIAVAEMLRRAIGNKPMEGIKYKIPPKVVVVNVGHGINKVAVTKELVRSWKQLCPECRFRLEQISLPKIPNGLSGASWRLSTVSELPKKTFSYRVDIGGEQQETQIFWLSGTVSIEKKVLVTTRSLRSGEPLEDSDVKYAYKDVTFAYDTTPTIEEIKGMAIRRTMRAGEPIWRNLLERKKVIQRGDFVKAKIGKTNWNLHMQAQAKEDGYVGSSIKLQNLNSKKMIVGKVVGPGEVVIE